MPCKLPNDAGFLRALASSTHYTDDDDDDDDIPGLRKLSSTEHFEHLELLSHRRRRSYQDLRKYTWLRVG